MSVLGPHGAASLGSYGAMASPGSLLQLLPTPMLQRKRVNLGCGIKGCAPILGLIWTPVLFVAMKWKFPGNRSRLRRVSVPLHLLRCEATGRLPCGAWPCCTGPQHRGHPDCSEGCECPCCSVQLLGLECISNKVPSDPYLKVLRSQSSEPLAALGHSSVHSIQQGACFFFFLNFI